MSSMEGFQLQMNGGIIKESVILDISSIPIPLAFARMNKIIAFIL